jgi:hypothetical protein
VAPLRERKAPVVRGRSAPAPAVATGSDLGRALFLGLEAASYIWRAAFLAFCSWASFSLTLASSSSIERSRSEISCLVTVRVFS